MWKPFMECNLPVSEKSWNSSLHISVLSENIYDVAVVGRFVYLCKLCMCDC